MAITTEDRQMNQALGYLRTIRNLLLVWTVLAGLGLVAGLLMWVNAVAPY